GKDISGNFDDISFVELYPINGSYKNYLSITFKWENEELNNSFIYDLYISEDENPTLYKSNNELSYLTASFEDEVKPLYWRVVARNIQGSSKSSQIFKIFPLDEDMDEIPDHIEASMCTSSNKSDTDGDNLSDNNEIQLGTNPCNSDTDSDGIPDGIEYQIGSDPLHQDSGTIVDNFNESYWESYVIDVEKQANLQGIKEESGSALLDVSDNDGYAISGIVPESDDFTMMYWVKSDLLKSQLSGSSDSSLYRRSYLGINKYGREYARYGSHSSSSATKPNLINIDEWSHLALSSDNKGVRVYINSELVYSYSGKNSYKQSEFALWFGALNSEGFALHQLSGQLTDIQIWRRGLSQKEVRKYMIEMPNGTELDLQAAYDFNRWRGDWVYNNVSGRYDLKLVHGAHLTEKVGSLDSDSDGLFDEVEQSLCTDPNNSDSDSDGLFDGEEYQSGTDPCHSDTDNDGIEDDAEYQIGSDPLVPDPNEININLDESYWSSYVSYAAVQADLEGIKEESGSGLLDVSDNDGYAISGIAPEGSEFSMMYWVKTDAITLQLSGSSDSSTYGRSYLGVSRYGREYMHYGGGYSKSSSEPKPIKAGEWSHLGMTHNAEGSQVYINGELMFSRNYDNKYKRSGLALWIGALNKQYLATDLFSGQITDVQVWNRGLTQKEVRQYMAEMPKGTEENLQAAYDFNRWRGDWVYNKVSGQYDLKLMNGAHLTEQIKKVDSDGDGISDGIESGLCTNVNDPDTDKDGLSDGDELNLGTDPCLSDTDGDGIEDGFEQQIGSDPLNQDSGDTNEVLDESYWETYVHDETEQAIEQGIPEEVGSALLDVTDNTGYAISGIVPKSHDFTMMYWVKATEIKTQISGSRGVTSSQQSYLGINSRGREYVRFGKRGSNTSSKPSLIKENQWVHLALSVDDKGIRVYINAELMYLYSGDSGYVPSKFALLFGALNSKGVVESLLRGQLTDVQIWHRGLNQKEIRQYMVEMPNGTELDLQAAYDFNRWRGDWVYNNVSGRYDLKLVHGAHLTEKVGSLDSDSDGLFDEVERALCTDPNNSDSDSDGLFDGEEYKFGTDPCHSDTDNDGIEDDAEYQIGSDPLVPDPNEININLDESYWSSYVNYAAV
ncbi:LamG-like jellyroll fold domain-containing protein, partial [Aliivibrio salmonicida]|uniref:LamG-like jellyroll fold domain-containing protein n=3 Tax=Aliivibrio salmonicida TaxID=40269 RepID=UPI0030ACF1F7